MKFMREIKTKQGILSPRHGFVARPPLTSATLKFQMSAIPTKKRTDETLRLGFVPLCDSAPIIMAEALGLYEEQGLRVQLSREPGWATLRDKLLFRQLDAAHATGPMVFAARLGLGSVAVDTVAALVLNLNGNAITLSRRLREHGVRDGKSLAAFATEMARVNRPLTFGIPFQFSSHHFLLRDWLLSFGLRLNGDVRLAVVPPPLMFENLASGNLDGYCVGEPWNSLAISKRAGWCVAISSELAPRHPEKVLMVTGTFATSRSEAHEALIRALVQACAYCDEAANREHLVDVLSSKRFLNLSPVILRASLNGAFASGPGVAEARPDFTIFHRGEANEPSPAKAAWIVNQLKKHALLGGASTDGLGAKAFRADIFKSAISNLKKHKNERNTTPASVC